MESKPARVRLIAPGLEFVMPYVADAMPETELTGDDAPDVFTIVVCSAAEAPRLAGLYPDAAVLACPEIVGTGMTGFPRRLAEAVMRGSFMHVPGREVPVSLIHAVDVGQAARLVCGTPGTYRISDGRSHNVDDLADALAFRMGDKRIFTLRMKVLQWLWAPSFERLTAGLQTVDGRDFAEKYDFKPVDVTDYLRTHEYDESSL